MAQVRSTIELIVRILRENGTSKIKAEILRQAKFNQNEAVPALWRLLFELVYYCQFNTVDRTAVKACGELSKEEMVVYVKREMQELGFSSRDFALLPSDMSSGSRELLLSVGWLMCKEHIIDRFMLNCTSPLDQPARPQVGTDDEDSELSNSTAADIMKRMATADPTERVQQLLWLNNKLRLSLRSLHALQCNNDRLRHKVHEATMGVNFSLDRDHLSMLEVWMLRNPDLLKKNLQLLERDNERLQNLLQWRNHEDIFWKWMESVLDMKLQEGAGDSSMNANMFNQATNKVSGIPASSVQSLKASHLNLRDAIIKYEAIVNYLERIWAAKSCDVSEEELDSILASIDLELSIQRANIALENTETYLRRHQGDTNWKYEPARSKKTTAGGDTASINKWTDVEEEISTLQQMVERLQNDIITKQESYRAQLQQMGEEHLIGTICIPPRNITL